MKIYRCLVYDAQLGALLSWHATRQEAERELLKSQQERGGDAQGPEGVRLMHIPTDKAGLIGWLNAYFKTDNG